MNDLSQQLADFLDEEPDPEWTHYKKFFFYMQIESEKRPSPPSPFISQWPSSTNLPPSEPSPLLLRHSPRPHRSEPGIARTSPTALGYSPAAASLGAAMSDQRLWIIAAVLVLAFLLGLVAILTHGRGTAHGGASPMRGGDTPRLWIEMVPANR